MLDYEYNTKGATMRLDQARAFVTEVNAKTGRLPGLYSGNFIKQQAGNNIDPVLSQCFFWLAQYRPNAVVPSIWPSKRVAGKSLIIGKTWKATLFPVLTPEGSPWAKWTLWQYTDGNVGPEPPTVPGIGACDRDKFNGDLDRLKALWGVR